MSRVTAPIVKLSRALGSTAAAGAISAQHGAGAALMPKYAELLRNGEVHDASSSSSSSSSSRGITTSHRPTPQPSLANRPKPLMQTFNAHHHHHHHHHTASPAQTTLDATIIPNLFLRSESFSAPNSGPRVPILPDNYSVGHGPFVAEDPVQTPHVSIVAADPENVLPGAPLSGVGGISLDGVELKFVHEHLQSSADEVASGGMISDLWRSMVDDVFGPVKKNTT
ncbi:hypothetical protein L249_8823 [Ophiocordyceps polyrhachis-furcata BCC 54312]|uniref:Uncharacterized protein n=1 Tax=Ophiocordyceps polyrhachis-furcata BCC 54312 TaxID=1330021 RepID=A0A367L256_9HYPO|nr:hypothetical protein L249_8823 [Ophiocordyceps polyrhachis-furcata BCC 54312]